MSSRVAGKRATGSPTSRIRLCVVLVLLPAGVVQVAEPKPPRPPQHTGPVEFNAVKDLSYSLSGPVVIGARIANPQEFPASFYASSKTGWCSSAMVGPRVLLTAAHCVADKGTITVRLGAEEWKGKCSHAPEYATNVTADWALCVLAGDGPQVPFETVNNAPGLLKAKDELVLTGFGCTKARGGGGNDGIYRIGEAPVHRLPQPAAKDFDIVTVASVALCFGDSGGPAFRFTDEAKLSRLQVGVNSRGNIKDTSYLASTSSEPAQRFFKAWATREGVMICGVHAGAVGCRP